MHAGALKHGYNYRQYLVNRGFKKKIVKSDMYSLLDYPEILADEADRIVREEEERYRKTCKYLNKKFGIKE